MMEWMKFHFDNCSNHGSCVMCALFSTFLQMWDGTICRDSVVPVLAGQRRQVSMDFAGGQQDAVEFFERFMQRVREGEERGSRCAPWYGVDGMRNVTHVERVFGFLMETRRKCTVCTSGGVKVKRSCETFLRLSEHTMEGGPMTLTELYYRECAKEQIADGNEMQCDVRGSRTRHETQTRAVTAPNVLVIQIRRREGVRAKIAVEEQLELPGMPVMELAGVVYHNGATFKSGHYTCLCRGPGGQFWFYDDKAVHKMNSEVAHIKPKEVVMAVYVRRDGSAVWKQHVRDEGVVEVDPVDGGGLSPVRRRRLRSKTPSLAESPAGGRRRENVTGTEQCDNMASPNRRRLSRKISA